MTNEEAQAKVREMMEKRCEDAGIKMTPELEVVQKVLFTVAENIAGMLLELQQENDILELTIRQLAAAMSAQAKQIKALAGKNDVTN